MIDHWRQHHNSLLRVLLVTAWLVTLSACHTAQNSTLLHDRELQPALLTKKHIDDAIAFEKSLERNYAAPTPTGTGWFTVNRGNSKVLVTAPHATCPTRKGKLRAFADSGTGSLAEMLHRLADTTVLYTTYASPSDPNDDNSNEFKQALAELINTKPPLLVLDLHVSHWNRPYDLDLGTMNGRSLLGQEQLLRQLLAALRREGLRNFSANYFAAEQAMTVTKFASTKGVPGIQLEFSSTFTSPAISDLHAHRYAQLLQALVRFVHQVDGHRQKQ